jgi:hypothetical protein
MTRWTCKATWRRTSSSLTSTTQCRSTRNTNRISSRYAFSLFLSPFSVLSCVLMNQLNKLVLFKFAFDTIVVPKESSWFGFFKDGDLSTLLSYNQTSLYLQDTIGLRTLDNAGIALSLFSFIFVNKKIFHSQGR